jgi:hypothetical protein
MKVRFIREEKLIVQTWQNENNKGQIITIYKGDIFETDTWGCGDFESVLTDKGEWICDIDCKKFNELFEVIE